VALYCGFNGRNYYAMKIEEGFLGQLMLVLPPLKRRKALAHPFSKLLYPTAIGYYPLASYHERERPEGSKDYILLHCVDGQGFVEENGTSVILNPDSFYILSKNTHHRYGSTSKKPWSIYWIHFNGKHADTLYHRYCLNRDRNHAVLTYDQSRTEIFDYLMDCMQKDFDEVLLETLYIHLLRYISSFTHLNEQHGYNGHDPVSKVALFMKENIRRNFELKDFAGIANYSVTRFSQLFRRRMGYAPVQYFLQLKIQYACQYLSFTDMSIGEIAEELGYADQFYFSRLFKKLTGRSPLVYRKQNTNFVPIIRRE